MHKFSFHSIAICLFIVEVFIVAGPLVACSSGHSWGHFNCHAVHPGAMSWPREVATQLVVIQPLVRLWLFLLSFSFSYFLFSSLTAIHNWHGDVRFGLPLDVGDSVDIVEECKHWYRGSCPRKSRAVGLFPKTYIHIKDLSKIDPVVAECTQVLREWSEIWKRLYVVIIFNINY